MKVKIKTALEKYQIYLDYIWKFILVAFLFYAFGEFSHQISVIAKIASPIWPASGIAIGFLFFYSRNLFPAVFVGCFLLELKTDLSWWAIGLIALGNTLECYLGATILKKVLSRKDGVLIQGELSGIAMAGFISAFVSAVFGVVALVLDQKIYGHIIEETFTTWFLGDLVGSTVLMSIFTLGMYSKNIWQSLIQEFKTNSLHCLLLSVISLAYVYFAYGLQIGNGAGILILPISYYLVRNFSVVLQRLYLLVLFICVVAVTLSKDTFVLRTKSEALFTLNLLSVAVVLTVLSLNHIKKEGHLKKLFYVIFSGWIIVAGLFIVFLKSRLAVENETWENLTRESINGIEIRFKSYLDALNGGLGLLRSYGELDNKEWRLFVQKSELLTRYPGINGMGIIYNVPKNNISDFMTAHQKKLVFNFPYHKVGNIKETDVEKNAENAFIISHIEPYSMNKPALGLDVGSEIKRRQAAEKSRDLGKAVMTDIIQLVQDEGKTPGFLLYVPFYKNEITQDTLEWRQKNHIGWVYAPIVTRKFLSGVLGSNSSILDLMVFDGEQPTLDRMTYSTAKLDHQNFIDKIISDKRSKVKKIQLGERTFTVIVSKNAQYIPPTDYTVGIVGTIGLLLVITISTMFSSNLNLRQRAEALVEEKTKELTNKEAFWRTIMESAPVGIFQTDLIGNCIYTNVKWCQITGYEFQDLVLKKWESIIFAEDLVKVNSLLDMQDSNQQSIEFRIRNAKAELIWIQGVSSMIVNDNGKSTGFVMILSDVTDKKNQQQIIENERIKLIQTSKMASLGVMAGGVAHEINNPLAIIMGKADRLLNAEDSVLTPEYVKGHVVKIEQMTSRIAKIIKGLRSFSRNSDKDPFSEFTIQSLLDDTLEFCRERFNNHSVKFSTNGDLSPTVLGRPTELSQVILNLLNNAFDAIQDQPQKWIKIESENNLDWVKIKIIDSGHGIPKEIADRLMEPFFTTKSVGKGTGLGLSISKGIIEDHHGHFYLDSTGSNTCFVIELPRPISNTGSTTNDKQNPTLLKAS